MDNTAGFEKTKRIIIGIIDLIIFHFSIYFSFLLRYNFELPHNYQAYVEVRFYLFIVFIFLNILFGVYIFYNKTITDMIVLTVIIQVIMAIAIMALTFFGRYFAFPRTIIFISFIISSIALSLWRVLACSIYVRYSSNKRVMLLGNEEQCKQTIFNFKNSRSKRHTVTKVALGNYLENVKKNIQDIDIIYLINNDDMYTVNQLYYLANKYDKRMFLETNFQNLKTLSSNILNIDDESIVELSNFEISPENDLVKRILDFSVSLIMLIILSPIILLTAILVKLTSPGPVFYRQVRITKGEREFEILKFRTMSSDAEGASGPVLATANDSRITPIGKHLRSLRIDELPQLFNVLKGDMSLVGPRPERPFFVNQFEKENPYYSFRHNVRAGITGYAQVYGKYSSDYNSKLKFDLTYIKDYSLIFDLKIMLQTIKILFDKVSSRGVEELEGDYPLITSDIEVYH